MILPSTGNVKTLTLLVEFADRPSRIPAATIASKIYGPGDTDFPYESPAAFYRRSSFGQLNFTGTTLGWFRLSQPLAYYAALDSNAAVQSMVTEALNYYSSPAGGSWTSPPAR